jgi:DNA-binding transcriptional regulator/RsmH inhibitor MraZ
MSVPARYREALQGQAEGRVTVTKHPDGCLLLFPRPEWEVFRAKIAALPMDAHWWRRIFSATRWTSISTARAGFCIARAADGSRTGKGSHVVGNG